MAVHRQPPQEGACVSSSCIDRVQKGALMVKIGSLSYACDENEELWKELNCFVEAESI